MLNFNKNDLINITLDTFYETFSHTLDTRDFVPTKYADKIDRYIYKNMKIAFKKVDKEDRIYQRELKKAENAKKRAEKKAKNLANCAENEIEIEEETEEPAQTEKETSEKGEK